MKKLKEHLKRFARSFRLDKRFLWVVLIDLLMIIFITSITSFLGGYIDKKANLITPLAQLNTNIPTEQMQAYASQMQWFIVIFVIGVIAYIFLVFLAWTVAQAEIWSIINKKNSDLKYFKKALLTNLIVMIPYGIITIVLSFLTNVLAAAFSVIASKLSFSIYAISSVLITIFALLIISPIVLLAINSLNLIYYNLSIERKIMKAISNMFSQLKLRHYIPHVLMSVVLLLLLLVSFLFSGMAHTIIYIILLVIFFAWMRFYLKSLVEKK